MHRKEFLRKSALLPLGLAASPVLLANPADPYPASAVEAFVRAGHNDLAKTREILEEYPDIVNAAWDWGEGDYETAIGGASHTGSKNIAEFLILQGARADIFTLTMLGKSDLVKAWLNTYPTLLKAPGPHGFTLLHHAQAGGHEELADFFQARGLRVTKL